MPDRSVIAKIRPYIDILRLVWPLALGMVNNAVMQFVDRAFLAKSSMECLEAVMPSTTLAWIFLGFFQSVIGYSGVFVAQYHGAGDEKSCIRCHHAALWLAVASSVMLLPCIPLGNMLFSMTASHAELAAMERTYYDIVMFGGFFLLAQMASLSYFTGRGQTRIVFWVNVLGNALNIALDPIMIFGCAGIPAMGIAGAAYATVISQAAQFAVLAIAAHRSSSACSGRCRRAEAPQSAIVDMLRLAARILRYGLPAGGYEVLNMASFTIFVFVTGRIGDLEFAASNACFTINYLLFAPTMGFAVGAQTLVGQARGRHRDDEARRDFRRTLLLGLVLVAVSCLAVLALHRPLLQLFAPAGDCGEAFQSLGFKLLLLMAGWLLFDTSDVIVSGALKGAGDTRFVFVLMLVCSFAIWLPLVFAVAWLTPSIVLLWSTMIIYVFILSACSFRRWHNGRWRKIAPLIQGVMP